jgi:putative transposase
MNKLKHNYTQKQLCLAAGFSKQAHLAHLTRKDAAENLYNLVLNTVLEVRKIHPVMGLKKIFNLVKPDILGRDKFLSVGRELGLSLPRPKNYQRTTFSNKYANYPNLTTNLEIRDINQVWVSDITYFSVNNIFYYITFVEDVYSRRIIGFSASNSLQAQSCCKALSDAINCRANDRISNLIHHSDRGTQYTSNAYIGLLKKYNISISMCNSVYENTHIERVNGIIKSEYLSCNSIQNFESLKKTLKKAVYLYNFERPHWSLACLTPVEYEKSLQGRILTEREPLTIFTDMTSLILKQYYQGTLFFE